MNTTFGQAQSVTYKSGTFDKIMILAHLFAKDLNTSISVADFKPEQVQLKVTLRRNNKSLVLINDNLLILGIFNMLKNGLNYFVNGWDMIMASANTKAVKQRDVAINLGGNVRLGYGDELIIELSPSVTCFNSAVIDTTLSYLEFYAVPSIGYEIHTPFTVSEVVQGNTNSQEFSLGNNITKAAFINLDKDNISEPVISSLNLSSDRLDLQLTQQRILAHIAVDATEDLAYRFGAAPPQQSVYRLLDMYPQSFILFDGERIENELDECKLNVTFNGTNVSQSKNFVVWRYYETSPGQINEALERQNKHLTEKIEKIAK